jgi:hypothetical protein
VICKFCGEDDRDDLLHAATCDGRQGRVEAAADPSPPVTTTTIATPRETSVQAFYNAVDSGLIETRQQQVYAALLALGASTATETFERVRHEPGGPLNLNGLNPRFAELRDLGVIREAGSRACRVTGKNCIVWEVIPSAEYVAAAVVRRCETCGQIIGREILERGKADA